MQGGIKTKNTGASASLPASGPLLWDAGRTLRIGALLALKEPEHPRTPLRCSPVAAAARVGTTGGGGEGLFYYYYFFAAAGRAGHGKRGHVVRRSGEGRREASANGKWGAMSPKDDEEEEAGSGSPALYLKNPAEVAV